MLRLLLLLGVSCRTDIVEDLGWVKSASADSSTSSDGVMGHCRLRRGRHDVQLLMATVLLRCHLVRNRDLLLSIRRLV